MPLLKHKTVNRILVAFQPFGGVVDVNELGAILAVCGVAEFVCCGSLN